MTIIFFVSLFVLCALLISKLFEVKTLTSIFTKNDEKIHKLIDEAIFKYNRSRKILNIFIFEFLPSYLYEVLVKMKDYVSKKYYNAGNSFRGKRVLRSNGSVSFFLERLSEDRSR